MRVQNKYKNMNAPKRKFLNSVVQQINDAYDSEPKVRLHYNSGIKKTHRRVSG